MSMVRQAKEDRKLIDRMVDEPFEQVKSQRVSGSVILVSLRSLMHLSRSLDLRGIHWLTSCSQTVKKQVLSTKSVNS